MAFIKRHMMLLSCGALGVLSLMALALGILLADVSAEMQEAQSLLQKLSSLGRDCVNDTHIRQAQQHAAKIAADHQKVQQLLKAMNARPPLRERVFPTPQRASDAYGFREEYRRALAGLLPNVLKAKSPPQPSEIQRMQLLIAKEKTDAAKKAQAALGPGARGGGVGFVEPGAAPARGVVAGQGPLGSGKDGPTIEELAKTDAEVRMSLTRAQETLCYATDQSLDVDQDLLDNRDVPGVEQMWDAQMSLWIQQDVLSALARINDAAAARLKPEDRWVAYMPVKELIGIRVGDYVLGPGATEAAGATAGKWVEAAGEPGAPPGDASAVFTQRTSNELYDVIQFAVELVVDARELPAVLDGLCGANFFTPLTVSCSAPAVSTSFRGKVYGPGPVLRVRIELEGCFLRDFYHYVDGQNGKDGKPEKRLMPESLSTQIVSGQRVGRDKMSPTGAGGLLRPGF